MKRFMGILFMLILNEQALQSAMVNPNNNHPENIVEETPGVLEKDIINDLLFAALGAGDFNQIFEILKFKEYHDSIIQNGTATILLHIAASRGQLGILEQLLKIMHINPDIQSLNGGTALSLAAQNSLPKTVTMLLEYKANVNKRTEQGFTALHWASIKNHCDVVKVLLKGGANPNLTDINIRTPLHYAVINASCPIIEELLKNGVDVNCEDVHFQTPLKIAQQMNDTHIIALLTHQNRRWFSFGH